MTFVDDTAPKSVTAVEGINEYHLANGLQILLIPDKSKSMVTVNMTVFVGSRHEGYGEAGMAHLLEHMLFKGTPDHPNIPELLKERGAQFNGTTWLDRTNYYESLPAFSPTQQRENLEIAIRLEADRLVNSKLLSSDLASEMTVVRSEFESGENNPARVLRQRVQAAAYDWHNYGQTTIGNLSDIERVPIHRLQEFYRKFYRPDNVMLVVAGKFSTTHALDAIQAHFGPIETPASALDSTYTTEPPQDGERTITLRRVGNVQIASAAYHVPAGANRQYAAVEMLAYIFGTEPAGRLYRSLVVPDLASSVSVMSMALHDPGLFVVSTRVPVARCIESAQRALIECVEGVTESPISETELQRAKTQFLKDRELRATDTKNIAIELSEWAAQGDWRLYFLFRDYVESLTPQECTAAATQFLVRNNRTTGLFIPAKKSDRVEIPQKPELSELLDGYEGRETVEAGEDFDPAPESIETRTVRGTLANGMQTVLLPKKTRGGTVQIDINLRYGNETSLLPFLPALHFLPEMLMRGTQQLDYQQLEDRLDELCAKVNTSGTIGLLSLTCETKRESLQELLPLLGTILRTPRFDARELEVLRRQAITGTEASMTEPGTLASLAMRRSLAPFDADNIRYIPTLAERIARFEKVTIEEIAELHQTQLNGQYGEIAAVGDFDPAELRLAIDQMFSDWTPQFPYARISQPAEVELAGRLDEIQTPDKANAVYYAGAHIRMRDDHSDYAALLVGNFILGGGALTSRLGSRVRQQEGLSYGVGSSIAAHPIDERSNWTVYAITNPAKKDRLIEVINEEFGKLLADGITEDELQAAQQGILQSNQLGRTQDDHLASQLAATVFAKRDMRYYANLESRIADLSIQDVNAALRTHLPSERWLVFVAGDFEKADHPSAVNPR